VFQYYSWMVIFWYTQGSNSAYTDIRARNAWINCTVSATPNCTRSVEVSYTYIGKFKVANSVLGIVMQVNWESYGMGILINNPHAPQEVPNQNAWRFIFASETVSELTLQTRMNSY